MCIAHSTVTLFTGMKTWHCAWAWNEKRNHSEWSRYNKKKHTHTQSLIDKIVNLKKSETESIREQCTCTEKVVECIYGTVHRKKKCAVCNWCDGCCGIFIFHISIYFWFKWRSRCRQPNFECSCTQLTAQKWLRCFPSLSAHFVPLSPSCCAVVRKLIYRMTWKQQNMEIFRRVILSSSWIKRLERYVNHALMERRLLLLLAWCQLFLLYFILDSWHCLYACVCVLWSCDLIPGTSLIDTIK